MNVWTALLSLTYFLFGSAAAAAPEPSRIVLGFSQSIPVAGPLLWLLVPLSLSLPVLLESFLALYRSRRRRGGEALHERLVALIEADALGEAMALLGRRPFHIAVPVYRAALGRAHQPMAMVERGVRIAEEEAQRELGQGRAKPFAVAAGWGFGGVFLGVLGERELAIGAAVVFLGCIVLLTILTQRRDRLAADLTAAALRIVDTLESRFVEAEPAAVTSSPALHKGPPANAIAAAMPAYEEMLEMPSDPAA